LSTGVTALRHQRSDTVEASAAVVIGLRIAAATTGVQSKRVVSPGCGTGIAVIVKGDIERANAGSGLLISRGTSLALGRHGIVSVRITLVRSLGIKRDAATTKTTMITNFTTVTWGGVHAAHSVGHVISDWSFVCIAVLAACVRGRLVVHKIIGGGIPTAWLRGIRAPKPTQISSKEGIRMMERRHTMRPRFGLGLEHLCGDTIATIAAREHDKYDHNGK
jgi:hypothetical protein